MNAAVLERGPCKRPAGIQKRYTTFLDDRTYAAYRDQQHPPQSAVAAGVIRNTSLHNLRGNVNTRLQKLAAENLGCGYFRRRRTGKDRHKARQSRDTGLDAARPAQGAIVVACRGTATTVAVRPSPPSIHAETALCTGIEGEFLRYPS